MKFYHRTVFFFNFLPNLHIFSVRQASILLTSHAVVFKGLVFHLLPLWGRGGMRVPYKRLRGRLITSIFAPTSEIPRSSHGRNVEVQFQVRRIGKQTTNKQTNKQNTKKQKQWQEEAHHSPKQNRLVSNQVLLLSYYSFEINCNFPNNSY